MTRPDLYKKLHVLLLVYTVCQSMESLIDNCLQLCIHDYSLIPSSSIAVYTYSTPLAALTKSERMQQKSAEL